MYEKRIYFNNSWTSNNSNFGIFFVILEDETLIVSFIFNYIFD